MCVVNQTLVRQLVDSGCMCVVNQTLVRQLVDSGCMCVVNQTLVRQLVDSGWMCVVNQTLVRQLMEGGWWLDVCEIEKGSTPPAYGLVIASINVSPGERELFPLSYMPPINL